ncbi:MAG TPA: alpha/beta fold hydrolase [Terriglobales bacterium]|nr:alpha/beta fold hydrolase [Terriglobales bacterium]
MRICPRSIGLAVALVSIASLALALPNPPPEKVAVVYGQNIRYIEAGQGPAVILLHGLGAVKEIWTANWEALSAGHHVYALDQIGFGHSDKPLLEYKIATWVDFLHGFMQSENIHQATLVGNSLGGWIALEFAAQHPEMVDRLVLVDSAGLAWGQGGPVIDLNPSSIAGWRTLLEALFYDKKMVSDQFVLRVFTDHMRNNDGYTIERALAGFALAQFEDDKLGSIHLPTLVVWGREDELISVTRAEKFRNGIPGAKLVVFEQCGHVPQLEKPDDFNRAVLDFLGR